MDPAPPVKLSSSMRSAIDSFRCLSAFNHGAIADPNPNPNPNAIAIRRPPTAPRPQSRPRLMMLDLINAALPYVAESPLEPAVEVLGEWDWESQRPDGNWKL